MVCIICHDKLDNNIIKLRCGHMLHLDCFSSFIDHELEKTNTIYGDINYNYENINEIFKLPCPYCRQDINYNFDIKITRSNKSKIIALYSKLDLLIYMLKCKYYRPSNLMQFYFLTVYICKLFNVVESLYSLEIVKKAKSMSYNLYKMLKSDIRFVYQNDNFYQFYEDFSKTCVKIDNYSNQFFLLT